MTVASSVDYVRGLKGKDSVLIKRDDLVRITPKLNFNGDFKDPANFPRAGLYIYEINTSTSGTFNGPEGNGTFYGTVEIISRIGGDINGLDVVTIKAYSYNMTGFMLIGRKIREKIRITGENGNKYIDIIKPVPAISVRTGITRMKSTWLAEPLSEGNFFYRVTFRNGFADFFRCL